MKTQQLTLYRTLLGDIKVRVRHAQARAALSANAEMIRLYWDVGRPITVRQAEEGWGAGVIPRLAADLKNELPEVKGFSERNIKLMVQFYGEYPDLEIGQRPVAQLEGPDSEASAIRPHPVAQLDSSGGILILQQAVAQLGWAHNVVLIQKVKDLPTRLWYARQTLAEGWSRDTLVRQIRDRAHERWGSAVTNFDRTLPAPHASLTRQLLKDPYLFDFLTLEAPFHKRELETGLLAHVEKFLLELGRGFAFVGRQHRLEVSDREFYLDLLFYHLRLRCFVIIDLKKGDFKPEYAGKRSRDRQNFQAESRGRRN